MSLDLENIYEGFKNLIFKNEEIEKQAEIKLKICFECPYRKDNRCGKCGCFIQAKTRSSSTCPAKKW